MVNKFSCEKDKIEFRKILGYNLQLICGKLCNKNSSKMMKLIGKLLETAKMLEDERRLSI